VGNPRLENSVGVSGHGGWRNPAGRVTASERGSAPAFRQSQRSPPGAVSPSILGDLVADKVYAPKLAERNSRFMRRNAAYRRSLEIAYRHWRWVEKHLNR
jgi:hypothetical protein